MENIDLNQSGIYSITSPSGKRYVGSAVNIRKRWGVHRSQLKKGSHHCQALQRAYDKYEGDLVYSVLVLCSKEELIKEEQFQMDISGEGTLYNSHQTAGSWAGHRHSPESRAKISASKKGAIFSEEHRRKIGERRRGRVMSPEARLKISVANKGKEISIGQRQKISAAHSGKEISPSHRVTLSTKLRGKNFGRNTSGYVGVCFQKERGNFRAYTGIMGRVVNLGSYPTAAVAAKARQNFEEVLAFYYSGWSEP